MTGTVISALISATGTASQISVTPGLYPVYSIATNPILPGTGSVGIPHGTTAQRVLTLGAMRLNTDTGLFEVSTDGATWTSLAGGGGGVTSVSGTANQITSTGGATPIIAIASNAILPGTGGVTLPTGTTGQRAGGAGTIRFNTTTGLSELTNDGATWSPINTAASSVDTVSGTANRITSTGGNNPIIDIAATYVGQASITTVGALSSGSLTAGFTPVPLAIGGTNAALTASNGGIFYSTATAGAILSGTATARQMLQSGASSAPAWSTTTWPATSTVNRILYSSSSNVIDEIATANSAVIRTTSSGVPGFTASLTDGQLVIGATGGTPAAASLTAGAGVTITPGANSISIAVTGGAAVNSVSGTANRITSTGGANPVIDISAAYVGQTSITTLGTITTGAWNASIIPLLYGGTNAALVADLGGIVYSTATALAILASTPTASKMLLSGASAAPTWSTSTIPSSAGATANKVLLSDGTNYVLSTPTFPNASATAGKIIRSDGTNWAASTATFADTYSASTLLYSNGANTVTGLATANTATLITSSSGVPSLLSLGAGQVAVANAAGTTITNAVIPGKNMLINGDFQVWQRGAGGSASFAVPASTIQYTADRWQASTNANQATTVTQSAGATSGSFLAKVQRNNGQTGILPLSFVQSLTRDMCVGAAGNIVTLSFKAKCGANFSAVSNTLNCQVYAGTGTNDVSVLTGFTGQTTPINQTALLTTTLTNYSFSSAALGSTITQLAAYFYFVPVGTAGADDSFSVTDVQVEISPNQTPFERKNFARQLLESQYFYSKSFLYTTAPAQNAGANTGENNWTAALVGALAERSPTIYFPVKMRAAPTITLYNPAAGNAQARDITAGADCSATATANIGDRGFYIAATGNAGTAVGNALGLHWQADIDLV